MATKTFDLRDSLKLWKTREKYRYRRWQRFVKTKPKGDPLRAKWFKLYTEAFDARKKREAQVAALKITQIDHQGELFIGELEGNIPYVYNDSQGHATVGIGHLLHLGNYTAADGAKWGTKAHQKYTKDEFYKFFQKDIEPYEQAVVQAFAGTPLKITQKMFNAAVSMCFNIGTGGLKSSSFARLVRQGDKSRAAQAMLLWNKPPEIQGRRRKEYNLFLAG